MTLPLQLPKPRLHNFLSVSAVLYCQETHEYTIVASLGELRTVPIPMAEPPPPLLLPHKGKGHAPRTTATYWPFADAAVVDTSDPGIKQALQRVRAGDQLLVTKGTAECLMHTADARGDQLSLDRVDVYYPGQVVGHTIQSVIHAGSMDVQDVADLCR